MRIEDIHEEKATTYSIFYRHIISHIKTNYLQMGEFFKHHPNAKVDARETDL